MDASEPQNTTASQQPQDEVEHPNISLPKEPWFNHLNYYYQGFWCPDVYYDNVIASQTHFQAHDTDIILASLPKTGTTWLKSLLFTVTNRKKNLSHISQNTLQSKNPHELILHLEIKVYNNNNTQLNLTEIPSPRLFATHMPYLSLPNSIKTSKCRIVYVCRNPLDTFVSLWHFCLQFDKKEGDLLDIDMMEYVGKFCKGASPFGPYEDHVLGYSKESEQNPEKVLFLEYEGLKKEPKAHVKKLAEFVGCPFSEEEEKNNVIDEIMEICSFKKLKEMEVNKSGKFYSQFENKALFRKGEVGDWTNYLTPSMAKQFDQMLVKLKEAGFCFTYYRMNV